MKIAEANDPRISIIVESLGYQCSNQNCNLVNMKNPEQEFHVLFQNDQETIAIIFCRKCFDTFVLWRTN